jgi:hypothetical protein
MQPALSASKCPPPRQALQADTEQTCKRREAELKEAAAEAEGEVLRRSLLQQAAFVRLEAAGHIRAAAAACAAARAAAVESEVAEVQASRRAAAAARRRARRLRCTLRDELLAAGCPEATAAADEADSDAFPPPADVEQEAEAEREEDATAASGADPAEATACADANMMEEIRAFFAAADAVAAAAAGADGRGGK